jgi:dihydrodipicolinate synthase/N-acetylneuraminate lyase
VTAQRFAQPLVEVPVVRSLELFAILPTPFTADGGELDHSAAAANIERLSDDGITDLLIGGSYGEFQSLAPDERVELVRTAKAAGRGRVMACAAQPSTYSTAALAQQMLDVGADLIMVSAPLACELRHTDILRHFAALSHRFGGQIVVYNNPVFGVDLQGDELAQIVALPGIVGIKQGTQSLTAYVDSLRLARTFGSRSVALYAAADLAAAVTIAAGGPDGLTSTNCWVFPEAFRAIVQAAGRGDARIVSQIAEALTPYAAMAKRFGQPTTVKAAMSTRGYAGGSTVRLPYAALEAEWAHELTDVLAECDDRLGTITAMAAANAKAESSWH